MKLTFCLVTKGRERYLANILANFEVLLQEPDVAVLIVDNGSEPSVRKTLVDWKSDKSSAVNSIRLDVNDSRQSTLWPLILDTGVDWTIFPGDDDELVPGIVSEWRAAVAEDPNLIAFASAAAIMNANGSPTGELVTPMAAFRQSTIERMAHAFHEPAFVWPALIFRVSKVSGNLPPSRYVFDWWVGINLLMMGDVKLTNSIGPRYRVHSKQESNLAPTRRKFFEASLWLNDLIRGEEFGKWAKALRDEDRLIFWKALSQNNPIYGDPFFSRPLVFSLARRLIDSAMSPQTAEAIALDLASGSGVFVRDGESINLIRGAIPSKTGNLGNLSVAVMKGSCDVLASASKVIVGRKGSRTYEIACIHSTTKSRDLTFNCQELSTGTDEINADTIVNKLTSLCERRGDFEIALSSGERASVLVLRSFRKHLPGRLILILRRIKNSMRSR